MKHVSLVGICIGIVLLFLTGFQCGSSEMTSAKLYIQQKNYEKADSALMKEIKKNSENGEAWYLLGRLKLDQDNIPKALEAFDKASRTASGKEFENEIRIGRTYAWQVSLNKGVNWYKRSETLQREQPEAMKDSVRSYRENALRAYHDAIAAAPESMMTYQNLAITQYSLGDYDAEIATLKEGLNRTHSTTLDTLLMDAYFGKYNTFNQKIQSAEAASKKQEASELYTQALTSLAEARKLYPENADLIAAEIDLYVRSGKADEAKPSIRAALMKDPDNKVYNYNLGVLLLQTDSLKEAISYFEKALAADANYEPALQNIAVTYMKLGDRIKKAAQEADSKKKADKSYLDHFKKAAEYFLRLTALKPEEANYYDYLASAYANAGDVKKAEAAIKKSDEIRKKK